MTDFLLETMLRYGVDEGIETKAIMANQQLDLQGLAAAVSSARKRGFPVINDGGKLYLARTRAEFDKALIREFRRNKELGIIEYR